MRGPLGGRRALTSTGRLCSIEGEQGVTMISIRLFLPGSMLFLAGLGCGTVTAPEAATAAGTYVLHSVDGCSPGPAAAECFPQPSWVPVAR